MKRIVLIFFTVSHGTVADHKGSDTLLTTSVLADDLAVFFITDDIFQLLPEQKPDIVPAHGYITIFRLLGLYSIKQCWVCVASLRERGLNPQTPFVVETTPLGAGALRHKLASCGAVLRF